MDPLESVLRCLGRGLSFIEAVEEAAVDTFEEVESLRSRHPNETSEEADDEMDGVVGDTPPFFRPEYGVSNLCSCESLESGLRFRYSRRLSEQHGDRIHVADDCRLQAQQQRDRSDRNLMNQNTGKDKRILYIRGACL